MKISHTAWLIPLSLAAGTVAVAVVAFAAPGASAGSARPAAAPTAALSGASVQGEVKPVDGRLGDVIPTGLAADKGGDWVIYGVPVKNKFNPKTTFGFAMAERDRAGK